MSGHFARIGELHPTTAGSVIYKRIDGILYAMMNSEFHVTVDIVDEPVIANGMRQQVDKSFSDVIKYIRIKDIRIINGQRSRE